MARQAKTNTASTSDNKDVKAVQNESKKNETNNETKVTTKSRKKIEIDDDEEIEVESLVANVSYYDEKSGDRFNWGEVGDVQLVPFETLKNMNRHFKGYFHNLYIKPKDERVISYFKLNRVYARYESILDIKNFTGKAIDDTCEAIKKLPESLKFTTFARIQNWVSDGSISDIKVVRRLEQVFGLELYSLLNLD